MGGVRGPIIAPLRSSGWRRWSVWKAVVFLDDCCLTPGHAVHAAVRPASRREVQAPRPAHPLRLDHIAAGDGDVDPIRQSSREDRERSIVAHAEQNRLSRMQNPATKRDRASPSRGDLKKDLLGIAVASVHAEVERDLAAAHEPVAVRIERSPADPPRRMRNTFGLSLCATCRRLLSLGGQSCGARPMLRSTGVRSEWTSRAGSPPAC